MKMKLFVVAIALSLLLSGMVVAVGNESRIGDHFDEGIESESELLEVKSDYKERENEPERHDKGDFNVIHAGPDNYTSIVNDLEAGDWMALESGTYTSSLYPDDLHGTAEEPIVISGPVDGEEAVIERHGHANTIEFGNSHNLTIRNLRLDGATNDVGMALRARHGSYTSNITLENLYIHDYDVGSQTAIDTSNDAVAFGWTIKNVTIDGASTGMYLGCASGEDGAFIGGTIENNVIKDTFGYNIQVKHQNHRDFGVGIPEGPHETVIRNNTFKRAGQERYRPNLLVGHFPTEGPGSEDRYLIYNNTFYKNEGGHSAFQGEGNVALYNNIFMTENAGVQIFDHNDVPKDIYVLRNTFVTSGTGISITNVDTNYEQMVAENAIFSDNPMNLHSNVNETENFAADRDQADQYLVNPGYDLEELDLSPVDDSLDKDDLIDYDLDLPDIDKDFTGRLRVQPTYGAYASETEDGYILNIEIKGEGSTDPSGGSHTYQEGEEGTVTATPDEGWYFVEWTGDHEGTEDEITITMDQDYEITAVFEEHNVAIENWHDLDGVRDYLGGDYVLMNDLDQDTDGYDELVDNEDGWEPIGDDDNGFSGTFDGNNHEIRDLYIDRPETDHIGLFGYVDDEGEVRNIGVVDADVSGDLFVGGLVGYNMGGMVKNSYATGNVTGGGNGVGGLVGENIGTVENSYATGNVSGDTYIGGLVGSNYEGTVENSYATGNVSGESDVGGLVGMNWDGTVENSYATGDVSGSSRVGGLMGRNRGTVSNSFYNIDSVLINDGPHITIGGIFTEQYDDWMVDKELDIEDYSDTLVPVDEHYEISSVDGLRYLLGFAWQEEYEFQLGVDIDLSDAPGLYIPYLAAEFYGNNYTISNLHIDIPFAANVGMFGFVDGGEISNIGMIDVDVSGDRFVGGLVGYFDDGMVENSYATGTVSGGSRVGGLVGLDTGTVENSYATGNVSGDTYIGGLVGWNSGTVENSYATGNVSGEEEVGGLVGRNQWAAVEYSYWNIETSGQDGSDGGEGRTTEEMTWEYDVDTYEGWDFEDIWLDGNHEFVEDQEGDTGYPALRWQEEEVELTINIDGEGTVDVDGEEVEDGWTGIYEDGMDVNLKAIPDDGWYFEEWTGDKEGKDEEITITMDSDKLITAHFETLIEEHDLTIVVIDEEDYPVEGANVTVDDETQETDENGEAVFDDLVPGTYNYTVEKEGYDTVEDEVEIVDNDIVEEVTLEEMAEHHDLTILVTDEEYERIEGAKVELDSTETEEIDYVETTDENGLAKFEDIPESTYEYVITHDDYLTEEGMIELTGEFEKDIVLEDAMILELEVQGSGAVNWAFNPEPVYENETEPGERWEFKLENGTAVELLPEPDEGWMFYEWKDLGEEYDEETGVTDFIMAEDKDTTLVFVEEDKYHTLQIGAIWGEGTVEVDGEEIEIPFEENYENGTEVTLSAIPEEDYEFFEWLERIDTGEYETFEEDSEITVVVEKDITLIPHFAHAVELGVIGEGEIIVEGRKTEDEEWVEHPDSPVKETSVIPGGESGDEIRLTAEPSEGYEFIEWDGYYEDEKQITFTLEEGVDITAVFEEDVVVEYHDLLIGVEDEEGEPVEGAVVTVEGESVETDEDGEAVFEELEPGTYNYTVEKEGYETVEDEVTMGEVDKRIDVIVYEDVETFYLTVDIEGEEKGNVIVEWNHGSHEVESEDTFEITPETEVTLTIEEQDDHHFVNWEGDHPFNEQFEREITIDMDDDKELTARFGYELILTGEGSGRWDVDSEDDVQFRWEEIDDEEWRFVAVEGTVLIFTAEPADDWEFSHWEGDYPGGESEEKEISITIDSDGELHMVFEDDGISLGICLGIGLVFVIAIVILVFLLMKKRKGKEEEGRAMEEEYGGEEEEAEVDTFEEEETGEEDLFEKEL